MRALVFCIKWPLVVWYMLSNRVKWYLSAREELVCLVAWCMYLRRRKLHRAQIFRSSVALRPHSALQFNAALAGQQAAFQAQLGARQGMCLGQLRAQQAAQSQSLAAQQQRFSDGIFSIFGGGICGD